MSYVKFGVGGAASLTLLSQNPIKSENKDYPNQDGTPSYQYAYQVDCVVKKEPVEFGGKDGTKLWWYATERQHAQIEAAGIGKGGVVNVMRKEEKKYVLFDADKRPLPEPGDNPFTEDEKPSAIPPEQQQAQAEKHVAKRGDGAGKYDLRNLSGEPFLVDAFIAGLAIVEKACEARGIEFDNEVASGWVSTCVINIAGDVSPRERAEAELRRVEELSTSVGTDDPDKVDEELAGAQDGEKTVHPESTGDDDLPF